MRLGVVACILACGISVSAVSKVTRTGRYLYADGARFFIKGIAYEDYNRLRDQHACVSATMPGSASDGSSYGTCPSTNDNFTVVTKLPPTPNFDACLCIDLARILAITVRYLGSCSVLRVDCLFRTMRGIVGIYRVI